MQSKNYHKLLLCSLAFSTLVIGQTTAKPENEQAATNIPPWLVSELSKRQYYVDSHPYVKNNSTVREWGKSDSYLALSIAVTNKVFEPKQQIFISISRKNITKEDAIVYFLGPFILYHFNVVRTDGTVVPMSSGGTNLVKGATAITSAYFDYLRSEEYTLEEFPLSKLYDLKTGTYKVFAMTDIKRQTEHFSGTNEWQKIISNEIEIIVK